VLNPTAVFTSAEESNPRRAIPVELLFVVSALSQYIGASIAVKRFDEVPPIGVAWLRVVGATAALLAFNRGLGGKWTKPDLKAAALLGMATALMNGFFFLAIDRLPLGKGVAIEFIGPIAVAAWLTRTRRNALALVLAAGGVVVLSGGEISGEPLGLLFILLASAMWAGYIVTATRVAKLDRGTAGLGVGLGMACVALLPIGLPSAVPAFSSWGLLALCLLVGVFSNAIGYGLDQFIMRRISTRRYAVMLALLPVTAVIVGFVLLHQRPTRTDLFGVSLVLAGLALQDRT
jgi:inner membrane transporter RhtA